MTEQDAIDPADPEQEAAEREAMAERLNALGLSLAKDRSAAIAARASSGIEQQWAEDNEYYEGIDDANRAEQTARHSKPPGQLIPKADGGTRSTVFVNITAPYVSTAAAKIADMILPTDERSFSFDPTPIPDLVKLSKGEAPPQMMRQAAMAFPSQAMQAQMPGQPLAQPAQPGGPSGAQAFIAQQVDRAKQVVEEARARADKGQTRIDDWFVESNLHAEIRSVIEDAARIGVGVLKGPFPVVRRHLAYVDGQIVVKEEVKPVSKRISPFDFYPVGDCGENIHKGSGTWERDRLTAKQLRELKGAPGYLADQIEAVIAEGPQKAVAAAKDGATLTPADDKRFEVWYYHGEIDAEDMAAADCPCEEGVEAVPAMLTLVNNRVIRASRNTLDTGDYPYDVMTWQPIEGHWAGIGVARQIRTAQRIVNAATRMLMDNAGVASGPMLIFRQGVVTPADGVAELRPRKVWMLAEDADATIAAERAIGTIRVDMVVNELMTIIQFGLKIASDVTSLPMLLQGRNDGTVDTARGMEILDANASVVARRMARRYDDQINDPHINRYYRWLLIYGEDEEKGDFVVNAHGSTAIVERHLQNQAIMAMGGMVDKPAFGIDPERWIAEWLKANRLKAKNFQFDDEQKAQMKQQPQMPPPQIAAAQIRAQAELQKAQLREQGETQRTQMEVAAEIERTRVDTDRDLVYVQSEQQRNASEHQARMAELQVKRELAMLDYANKRQITLDKVKAELARDAAKINLQRELATTAKAMPAPQVAVPPTEPKGRAPNGQAFQR